MILARLGGDGDWKIVLAVTVVVVLGLVISYRLLSRDPTIRRTRYGFYIERDKFDEPEPWPSELNIPPPERTLPNWPDRDKTAEIPPKEEK